jgi:hypothetical protein
VTSYKLQAASCKPKLETCNLKPATCDLQPATCDLRPVEVYEGDPIAASLDIDFRDDGVAFRAYPFAPASVYPSGVVSYSAVREVLPEMWPPEIRTHSGEVLFVSATQKDQLLAAAARQALPLVERVDLWALILEPFLDTEFDQPNQQRTLRRLQENGVDRELCEALRQEFGPGMYHYNFATFLWEWVHLGLYDLFCAVSSVPSNLLPWRQNRSLAAFYWEAMQIANRGHIIPPDRPTV